MLESVFIILLILAIIFLIIAVDWNSPVICGIDMILWLVLALGVLDIEVPYQYVSSGSVTATMQSIETMQYLGYLFMGIAVVMFIYMMTMVLETLYKKTRYGI